MTTITDYILSYDDVRAILGLSKSELKDATLQLPIFELQVEGYLDGIYVNLRDIYLSLREKEKANVLDPNSPALTKNERKIVGMTRVISTYAAAYVVSPNVKAYGLKKITDGKAEGERFANSFDSLVESIQLILGSWRDQLLDVLKDYGENIPDVPYVFAIATATIGVDPVTGE